MEFMTSRNTAGSRLDKNFFYETHYRNGVECLCVNINSISFPSSEGSTLAHLLSHEVWCHDIDTLYSALTQFVSDDDNSERSCHGDLTWSPITYQKLSIILKICQYCTGRLISSSSEMGLYQFYPGTALDSLWSPRHKLAPLNIYCRHNFQASVLPTVTYPGQGGLGWLNLASFMSITSPDIDYPNISTVLESHTHGKVKCI